MATILGTELEYIPDEPEVGLWTIAGRYQASDGLDYDEGYAAGYIAGYAAGLLDGDIVAPISDRSCFGWLSGWLGAGNSITEDEPEPVPDTIPATDFEIDDPLPIDHVEAALDRLCEQFKSDDEDEE